MSKTDFLKDPTLLTLPSFFQNIQSYVHTTVIDKRHESIISLITLKFPLHRGVIECMSELNLRTLCSNDFRVKRFRRNNAFLFYQ